MSRFWDKLGAEHAVLLKNDKGNFRNTVATRYFTDKRNDTEEYIRSIASKVGVDMDDSMFGNPFMVEINGKKVTQDLLTSLIEVSAMKLDFSKIKHVCEIGAGYGRTAYILLKRYPHLRYTILDVEPAISLSREHLTKEFPKADISFNTNPKNVDLFLAISVLTELSQQEIDDYFKLFQTGKYLYLKDWHTYNNREDDVIMGEWPIPKSWKEIMYEADPITENFFHALYGIR